MRELFVHKYPELAENVSSIEHPKLKLEELSVGSVITVTYTGKCGHTWNSPLKTIIDNMGTCPYCTNRKVLAGVNDVASHLESKEHLFAWAEPDLEASDIITVSTKKSQWLCLKCNNLFIKTPYSLFHNGVKCPYCNNKHILVGFNDLAATNPALASEWNYEKNAPLLPTEVFQGTGKNVWWVCELGHEWKATISVRSHQNTKCPVCANKKVLPGFNDLATTHPNILNGWDYEKNTIQPTEITAGSDFKAWWKCSKGHSQLSYVYRRVSTKQNCLTCTNKVVLPGFNDLATTHPELLIEWDHEKNIVLPTELTAGSNTRTWWKCSVGHKWQVETYHRGSKLSGTFCPACNTPTSKNEDGLVEYVKSILPTHTEILFGDKTVLSGRSLDLYIPAMSFAIEYNGIYWHSDKVRKDKEYHYIKWLKCKDKGIQLVQVWEDDWQRNPEQVKRMLAHKLGVSQEPAVFARKTIVQDIPRDEASVFLEANHIQGAVDGSIRVGLYAESVLVALMVLKKEPDTNGRTLNLLRYATSQNVAGGFTKLLKHVERTYTPERVITFSDHCVSDGGLYENNGFVADKELPPDYMYVVKNVRQHKFGYRLKRFRDDPNLLWEEGLTERELAILNGLPRVWDAGKTRWVRTS